MSLTLAVLGDFGEAIEFLFSERESVSGGVQIGGPAEMLDFGITHMIVSVAAILIASLLAIPLSLWLGHIGKGDFVATATSNVGRAVPSLALLAFFISFVGLGYTNVISVLVLLAIPPLITSTYVGIRQVDRDTVDAARGQGMTGMEIVRKVELPLALPTILAGVKTAAVINVGTATVAAFVGAGGFGERIAQGLALNDNTMLLAGALPAAALALVVHVSFEGLERLVASPTRRR